MSKEELLQKLNDTKWDGNLTSELIEFLKKHFTTCRYFDGISYSSGEIINEFPKQIV